MKQDLLVCLLWSAKTPLKVCDTSIAMIRFYKLTFFGFDCGFTSSRAMRDMVTADSGWGTSKLVLAVGWGQIDLIILSNFNWIWNFGNPFYCSVSNYKVKKQLIIFEKLWLYYYKYAEICKISPNLVCNEEKLKKN